MKLRLFSSLLACALISPVAVQAQDIGFTKTTIDFGIVVSDLEKALAFYTDVVGFKRAGNFTVDSQVANDSGLTKISKPLVVEMLKLGDDASATTLKLMQIPDAKQQKPANGTIHASLGMSYMTVFVTDTKAALARGEARCKAIEKRACRSRWREDVSDAGQRPGRKLCRAGRAAD